MKLLNFIENGERHVGVLANGGVIDVTAAGMTAPMESIIAKWDVSRLVIASMINDADLPRLDPETLTFAPATNPSKILCVGLNYSLHAAETGGETPPEPAIFCKLPECAAGHREAVPMPPAVSKIDYEAELVAVIGKHTYNVSREEAEACIFGYTCGNDVSARDSQFRSSQWLIGKCLPKFAPSGPYIVTADENNMADAEITCHVNGELRQSARTSDMTYSPADVVAYVSQFIELHPGDLIYTGTPSGVIIGMEKGTRIWLKPGDEMTVSIEGIGSLVNRIE